MGSCAQVSWHSYRRKHASEPPWARLSGAASETLRPQCLQAGRDGKTSRWTRSQVAQETDSLQEYLIWSYTERPPSPGWTHRANLQWKAREVPGIENTEKFLVQAAYMGRGHSVFLPACLPNPHPTPTLRAPRDNLQARWLFYSMFYSVCFEDRISGSPGWSQPHLIAKDDSELLIFPAFSS